MKGARKNAIAFLGGGRITGALLAGLRLAGDSQPILVHDRHPQKLRQLRIQYGVKVELDLHRTIEQAHLLIVAVRPDSVRELLQQIGQARPAIAVSLAAGIPFKNLRAWMGRPVRWARAMPSPVARSGRGLTALAFDTNFPAAARREVRNFFARVGQVLEIPESKFDAFTAAAHALADGVLSWRESNISLDALLHEAATPGGISAATLASMDKSGYKRVVEQGLRAGMSRAKRNAKR